MTGFLVVIMGSSFLSSLVQVCRLTTVSLPEIVRGYCAAVRAALTDDGLPPLSAAGLKLQARLTWIVSSLERVRDKAGGFPASLTKLRKLLHKGLKETASLWPPVKAAYPWVH